MRLIDTTFVEILIYLLLVIAVFELWMIGDRLREVTDILNGIRIRQSEILRQTKTELPPDWWEYGKDESFPNSRKR